ncbi:MAG: mechanosensitive ion channel family protein [Bacteroidetes bacterium]|nr:mechanosensitive ion channel family protein [Bacteroidota bacterium]MBU1371832.1 mechanosensitive ion channel family protein [Bacteroidota bacterium]MBU1483283.1 mechanosensitive ion channel family protein [Bacteroidota bacterium]MBU1761066.1 mechanosensitive ion channel family protein [Bacteroidota bacterium]MBU2374712.1 mechanosensitive ion channel family protein [Bacteroidota bacterium]
MNLDKAYNLLSEKLVSWFDSIIKLLPNLALAAIVIVLGIFISKLLRRYSLKMIRRFSKLETINKLFASFMFIVGIGITLFTALDILNLDKAVTTALTGAGILGLALAFAFQDIAANFMSGIFMSFRHPFNVGDLVIINDKMGEIEAINLRDTTIITLQGQRVIIPNKQVFQNTIENYTSTGNRRLDFSIGVSYGDDLEQVKTITINAVESLSFRDLTKKVSLVYDGFGDSSINFMIRIWLNSTEQSIYMEARSEAIIMIKKAYDNNNITIPFPIRTLDFGIKGGQNLSEMKLNLLNKKD